MRAGRHKIQRWARRQDDGVLTERLLAAHMRQIVNRTMSTADEGAVRNYDDHEVASRPIFMHCCDSKNAAVPCIGLQWAPGWKPNLTHDSQQSCNATSTIRQALKEAAKDMGNVGTAEGSPLSFLPNQYILTPD